MRAGKLDQRITIRRKTTTYNSYHEPIDSWSDVFTGWAEAITKGGKEFSEAQKQYGDAVVDFRLRYDVYSAAVTENDQLTWNGLTYHVLNAENVNGLRKEIMLSTRKVT